MLTSNFAFK